MPEIAIITGDEAKVKSVEDLYAQKDSSLQGLTSAEVEQRLAQFGLNSLKKA